GALHNPHAYGYFDHAPHDNFRGGHVTVGGLVYQADNFPASFHDTYIAGDLLGHGVYWHAIRPYGSTVRTAHGGELLVAGDSWFAPTDVTVGPDGAIYIADWHDARTAHPDPDADWDRSNGRIYRLAYQPATRRPAAGGTSSDARLIPEARPASEDHATVAKFFRDFTKLSTDDLQRQLAHPNQWHVRRARCELIRRWHLSIQKPDDLLALRQRLRTQLMGVNGSTNERSALESLWTLHVLEAFDESLAFATLSSPHASVRAWTVRLLGDSGKLSPELAHRLDALAETEAEIEVRQQLAASAARFPARDALPIINANINRDLASDRTDPFLPLLWWWAVERHSVSGREEVLKRFTRPSLWTSALGRDLLLPKLIRRFTAEASREGLDSVARLIAAAPDEAARVAIWPSVLLGWREQPRERRTDAWLREARSSSLGNRVLEAWRKSPDDAVLLDLALALRFDESREHIRQAAFDDAAARVAKNAATNNTTNVAVQNAAQVAALERLAPLADRQNLEPALRLFRSAQAEPIRLASLKVLAEFDDQSLPDKLIDQYLASPSPVVRAQVRAVLLSRVVSARAWLEAVDGGRIPASATPLEEIRRVALFESAELDRLVGKHWGKLDGGTREEKLAEVRRLNNDLRAASGDADAGRQLFRQHCGSCHLLFGEGAKVGPDLTTANRQDRDFLLVSMVDPSSVIRKEYIAVVVETNAGRTLSGLPIAKSDTVLTLVDPKGERLELPLSEIAELRDSPVSLMPENLYRQFTPRQLRDLFAYLQRVP
ncbi:MAG: dehydrogenase, partial [Planctomycetota bacterium]